MAYLNERISSAVLPRAQNNRERVHLVVMLTCINLVQGLVEIRCNDVAEFAVRGREEIKISLIKICGIILGDDSAISL